MQIENLKQDVNASITGDPDFNPAESDPAEISTAKIITGSASGTGQNSDMIMQSHTSGEGSETADHEHNPHGDEYGEHEKEPDLRDLPLKLTNIPRFIVLGLIRVYQATFSRTLPQDTCRFYPSCSHYGYQAIYKYGVLKGGVMAVWRVVRCNPFNKGGFDPVR